MCAHIQMSYSKIAIDATTDISWRPVQYSLSRHVFVLFEKKIKYLGDVNMEEWHEMWMMLWFPLKKLARKGIPIHWLCRLRCSRMSGQIMASPRINYSTVDSYKGQYIVECRNCINIFFWNLHFIFWNLTLGIHCNMCSSIRNVLWIYIYKSIHQLVDFIRHGNMNYVDYT